MCVRVSRSHELATSYTSRVGFVEGIWIIGKIDEIRLPLTDSERYATLVDTKTRVQRRLPSEPQRRNGRYNL